MTHLHSKEGMKESSKTWNIGRALSCLCHDGLPFALAFLSFLCKLNILLYFLYSYQYHIFMNCLGMSFPRLSIKILAIFLFAHLSYLNIKSILDFLNDSICHFFQIFFLCLTLILTLCILQLWKIFYFKIIIYFLFITFN